MKLLKINYLVSWSIMMSEIWQLRMQSIIRSLLQRFQKDAFVQVSSNIGKYRYKYVDLNLKGAVDFLRGFKWFYNAESLGVHGWIKKI